MATHTSHPLYQLLQQSELETIRDYCRGPPLTKILWSSMQLNIYLLTRDIQQLVTHNTPIYHELLNLSLEIICQQFGAKYLDPSFFPTLESQGWAAVQNHFARREWSSPKPSLNSNIILILIHIGGNHWIALARRSVNGIIHFYYSDDLNVAAFERQIKTSLSHKFTSDQFFPQTAKWINCRMMKFSPNSNECGPRTILALAVMASHPAPDDNILLPYMHTNLTTLSRLWMCKVLLTGTVSLLPHSYSILRPPESTISSVPKTLINWRISREEQRVIPAGKLSVDGPPSPRALLPIRSPLSGDELTVIPTRKLVAESPRFLKKLAPIRSPLRLLLDQISESNEGIVTNIKKQDTTSAIKDPALPICQTPNKKETLPQRDHSKLGPPNKKVQATLGWYMKLPATARDKCEDVWGHYPDDIDQSSTFRVLFNNPCGLGLGTNLLGTQYSLSIVESLGVGGLCLAEMNLNWGIAAAYNKVQTILRQTWRNHSMSHSHLKENFTSWTQPGGTATIITNNWTSRIVEKGMDPFGLGRWSYTILRGKSGVKILIITAYQVCLQTATSTAPKTSTSLQLCKLSALYRSAEYETDPIPRRQFIIDLQAWIEHMQRDNHDIILFIDANEAITEAHGQVLSMEYTLDKPILAKGHDRTIATLVKSCGLQDPLLRHHAGTPPPTYNRGKERIDFIFTSPRATAACIRSGLFPFHSIFMGDHMACYLDFDGSSLFRETTAAIEPPRYCGLQCHDPRIVAQYREILHQYVDYHKLDIKVAALLKKAKEHPEDTTIPKEYEKLEILQDLPVVTSDTSSGANITVLETAAKESERIQDK